MVGLTGAPLWDLGLQVNFSNNIFWLIAAVAGCFPILPALSRWMSKRRGLDTLRYFGRLVFTPAMLLVSTAMLVGQSYRF